MPTFDYGPGFGIILIVGVFVYLIIRLFRKKIRYPFCPNKILSYNTKISIIFIFQIVLPIIISGIVYNLFKKIKSIERLFVNNELLIPLVLILLIICFAIIAGYIIENILKQSNPKYDKWTQKSN